jgi:hypothetical protein
MISSQQVASSGAQKALQIINDYLQRMCRQLVLFVCIKNVLPVVVPAQIFPSVREKSLTVFRLCLRENNNEEHPHFDGIECWHY